MKKHWFLIFTTLLIFSCTKEKKVEVKNKYEQLLTKYFEYPLKADLTNLSDNDKKMIPILIEVANIMDELFWEVACGPYKNIYDTLKDEYAKKYFKINYGPWDRLNGNAPFIDGIGPKPKGAFFYPADMTEEEFEKLQDPNKASLYTIIVRDENKNLKVVPYSVAFGEKLKKASDLLMKASEYADDPAFKKYLQARAKALITDNYFESDMLWLDVKNSNLDFVVGPIEVYEDELFNYKAAFEAYILVKDHNWSKMLNYYTKLLPKLQQLLPVEDKYKKEKPGDASDLNAYEVIYYAGDCNAGSKTIAINLPNDEQVQLKKGSRRLQLKNAMEAKFNSITKEIANIVINLEQKQYVTFNAFFANTMFHEVAHGLGIKNTIDGKSTVQKALRDLSSAFEETKADALGLWLIYQLIKMNEYEINFEECAITFLTNIFRSIRFGISSAHAKANLMIYNYFIENKAFERTPNGIYTINYEKFPEVLNSYVASILRLQGDGNYDKAKEFFDKYSQMSDELKKDLEKINNSQIPVDVVWQQGLQVLNL